MMRKYLLAAAAVIALTPPAAARDGSGYVGVEGGALFPRNTVVRSGDPALTDERLIIDQKTGFDVDAIAGYDFGAFRVEAELGWKRAKHEGYEFDFVDDEDGDEAFDGDGRTQVVSVMGNALADFGDEESLSFYAGGGIGWAWTKFKLREEGDGDEDAFTAKDDNFAWQLIAGVRYAMTPQTDIGLKYRYFQTKFNRDDLDLFEDDPTDAHAKFKSHSVLLSLAYNFAPPSPPPPPLAAEAPYTPPPPPTAPVTEPVPAPEPAPAPRTGERG
jgi:OOP family OmpA-OmpF porin